MDENWYCKVCNFKIFPNYLLNNKPKDKIYTNSSIMKLDFITYDDCSVCTKKLLVMKLYPALLVITGYIKNV